jgi:hypothetical protein
MPVKDIEKASPEKLKEAYEQDYKTPAERLSHVHTQVIKYNVIGGGMRLIFDSKSSNLFLSCRYSTPALVTASGAGSAKTVRRQSTR